MKQTLVLFMLLALQLQAQTKLDIEQAKRLIALPLKCIQQEYPNKMGQVLNATEDLKSPAQLHPAFYGCFDWHSSVHGHWLIVKLVKIYPELLTDEIRAKLQTNLSADNIQAEVNSFDVKNNGSFERTYGWAWFLKLQQEVDTWDTELGRELARNLQPLSNLFSQKLIEFLPKLNYPIRSGDHINTAFGLSFAYDYAIHASDALLKTSIEKRARDFYFSDKNYPLHLEPSGYDFLSGGLEEADLMRKVLTEKEFKVWLKSYLPGLFKKSFSLEPGKVTDRTDGHLVHLDGLNFSRSWCLNGIVQTLPELAHLKTVANAHLQKSLPNIVDGDYMGEHWLASFALLALISE